MGFKIMLDYVPNHSDCENPLLKTNNDYFIRAPKNLKRPYNPETYLPNGEAYGKDPVSGGWVDTVQWNVWNLKARDYKVDELIKIGNMCDAIRVDMAMLLLNDIFQRTWASNLESHGFRKPSEEYWIYTLSRVKKKVHTNIKFFSRSLLGFRTTVIRSRI